MPLQHAGPGASDLWRTYAFSRRYHRGKLQMIDVSELRKLRANEFRRMEDIEEIFDALVTYPEGQGFHNATRADLIGALSAATLAADFVR